MVVPVIEENYFHCGLKVNGQGLAYLKTNHIPFFNLFTYFYQSAKLVKKSVKTKPIKMKKRINEKFKLHLIKIQGRRGFGII